MIMRSLLANRRNRSQRRKSLQRTLVAFAQGAIFATCLVSPAVAQTMPGQDDTVDVTSDPSTWLQEGTANAITIPTTADGVVITNGSGGVISSQQATGIETSANTTVFNFGSIFGGFNGINFVNGFGSGILNNGGTGTISSDSRAVNIGGAVQLTNQGQIFGTGDQRNGTIYSDSVANNFSITNESTGTIDAGAGNQGAGIGLEIGQLTTATITNDGLIQGRTNTPGVAGNTGLSADGLRLANFTAPVAGQSRTFNGSISNSSTGSILSESNSGTIAGVRVADGVGFAGTLDNSGLIAGTRNGLYFGNGDHLGGVVNNDGQISSGSRALNIDGTGLTVNNSGQILGSGNQRNGTVYADSTAQQFSLNNSSTGIIDAGVGNEGAGFSVELSNTGNDFSIVNDGLLAGRGNASAGAALAGDGIRLERTRVGGAFDGSTTGLFLGRIENSGVISSAGANGTVAGFRAVNGVSFQGELSNSGTISGTQNGVYFGNPVTAGGADHTGGVVNNSGTISSDSRAFNLDGNGLIVNNSGSILATGRQRNGTFYVDGTADNFTLLNSGAVDARGGAGSGLSFQVGSFDGDVQNGLVVNSGLIVGSGTQSLDAGIRLFTNANQSVFSGDIVNATGGFIGTDGDATAVLVDDDVQFDGSFVNLGTLEGNVRLNDADLILGETSILSLEISSLTDFESVETSGAFVADGILDITFADGFSPSAGQSFDLLDFGSITGGFDFINSGNVQLDTSDLFVGGSVSISAIPEPSAFAVMSVVGVLMGTRRRRVR